ncbi:MAG TPA: hypothetical protein DEQ23_01270 [Chlorobium sp.]|nr:hypothetical protein [Chlorobium sp.]
MSFLHGGAPSVNELAANAYGIIRNHPFIDDTKRTGFLAAGSRIIGNSFIQV